MAKKGAMPSFKSVDAYIKVQSEEAQQLLNELRAIIKRAVPDAIELPDCKVPSFTLVPGTKPNLQLMVAAYSKFVSFYPFEATVNHFSDRLKQFDHGKGAIKFQYNKPLPVDLIFDMVCFRKKEVLQSKKS